MQTIKVKTNEENPESIELIAQSIINVSEAFEKINSSPLKRRVMCNKKFYPTSESLDGFITTILSLAF